MSRGRFPYRGRRRASAERPLGAETIDALFATIAVTIADDARPGNRRGGLYATGPTLGTLFLGIGEPPLPPLPPLP
jgi:hypothetical protein